MDDRETTKTKTTKHKTTKHATKPTKPKTAKTTKHKAPKPKITKPKTTKPELLYAILSQICLEDIDWNEVASNAVLAEEGVDGDAACKLYSSFKELMESNVKRTAKVKKTTTESPNKPGRK